MKFLQIFISLFLVNLIFSRSKRRRRHLKRYYAPKVVANDNKIAPVGGKNNTNKTNSTEPINNLEILNPSKMAIKFQAFMYQIEQRIGIQPELKEIFQIMQTFQTEKNRLILIDKTQQGALPLKNNTNSTKNGTANNQTAAKKLFLQVRTNIKQDIISKYHERMNYLERANGDATKSAATAPTPAPAANNAPPIANPCKYVMSPETLKLIEKSSRSNFSEILKRYRNLLKLSGPQIIMVRLSLLLMPLENLEKQNILLTRIFMEDLAENLEPDATDQSP